MNHVFYKFESLILLAILSIILLICCKNDELTNVEKLEEEIEAPDSLRIESLSGTSVRLLWHDNSTSETNFVVERGEGYTPQSYMEVSILGANITSYTDNQLDKTKIYSYRVKSIKDNYHSPYSPKISVKNEDGIILQSYSGHGQFMEAIDISPDDQLLATGGEDEKVIIWNLNSATKLHTLTGQNGSINSLNFSNDGQKLVSGGRGGYNLIIWDVNSGSMIRNINMSATINSVVFSPDDQKVAVTYSIGLTQIGIYDASTGTLLTEIQSTFGREAYGISFSPDGNSILVGFDYIELGLWNVSTGDPVWLLELDNWIPISIGFTPIGDNFAVANYNGAEPVIQLRRKSNKSLIRTFEGHLAGISAIVFSADGQRLASSSSDGTVKIWNVNTGEILYSISEYNTDNLLDITSDGNQIICSTNQNTVSLWELQSRWSVVR